MQFDIFLKTLPLVKGPHRQTGSTKRRNALIVFAPPKVQTIRKANKDDSGEGWLG